MGGESIARVAGLEPDQPSGSLVIHALRAGPKDRAPVLKPIPGPDGSKDGDEMTLTLRANASVTGRFVDENGKSRRRRVTIQVRHVPTVKQFRRRCDPHHRRES